MSKPRMSLSFSGCAWLLPYHLGAIEAFYESGLCENTEALGASSGALAATTVALGLDPQRIMVRILSFAHESQQRRLGPAGRMWNFMYQGLCKELPENPHLVARGKLKIAVTHWPHFRRELVDASQCRSREDLIHLLMGSGYIPLYYERPIQWQGRWLLDGGLRNNQPLGSGHTLTISPISKAHISPERRLQIKDLLLPKPSRMEQFFELGCQDTKRFLQSQEGQKRWAPRVGKRD